MLEDIALSISTLVVLLCNLVVNSMAPAAQASPMEALPQETAAVEAEAAAIAPLFEEEPFDLVGEWNSGGRIFEFTASGKLLYNDQVMTYEQSGGTITVTAIVDGSERVYTLAHEPVSARVMKLNGVTMYKTSR